MSTSLSSVMTAKPACCTADTSLAEVAKLMMQNDCGQIPVVDSHESGKPVGVITDRDIVVRMVAEGRDMGSATASDCMTTPATTVGQDASLADCCAAMEQNQIRRVVVVDDNGAVCGIVAQADIARTGRDEKTAEVVQKVSQPTSH
ncbi:MAG: CBS domain-containing protein [Lysobacter sp.]